MRTSDRRMRALRWCAAATLSATAIACTGYAVHAEEPEPLAQIAREFPRKWPQSEFEFVAIRAKVTDYRIPEAKREGFRMGTRPFAVLDFEVLDVIGATGATRPERGSMSALLAYSFVVLDGELLQITGAPGSEHLQLEQRMGVGDSVLLLLGRGIVDGAGSLWWNETSCGDQYSVWWARLLVGTDAAGKPSVTAIVDSPLPEGFGTNVDVSVDLAKTPRVLERSMYGYDEWIAALDSFLRSGER